MAKIIDNRTTPGGEHVFSAFLHSKARQAGIPLSGTFELTSRCNFDCKMCYIHSDNSALEEKEISADKWIELGRRAKEAGMLFLLLTGGEPLMRQDFPQIYRSLNEMGFIMSVNTNASLITDEIIELFKAYTPHRINISLYGSCGESYRNLCRNNSFERVLENIKRLKSAGIQVKLNSSITPYNCSDIEGIYSLAEELDTRLKAVTYMYPPVRRDSEMTGINEGRFTPSQAAFYKVKYDLLRLGKEGFLDYFNKAEQGIRVCEDECIEPDSEGERISCRAGVTTFWVDCEGYMRPCGMIDKKCLNVFENNFYECWQSVRKTAAEIRLPVECSSCEYKSSCSVCAAVCHCETGSFSKKPEYMCEYVRKSFEFMKEEAGRLKGE